MRPFEILDEATTPEGRHLTLNHRDGDYFIDLDGHEIMSTRAPGSELALAKLACRHLAGASSCRVLIGGLGLGFTLRAALEVLPAASEVVVAEVFPSVVQWHSSHLLHLGGLDDSRVHVHHGDVQGVLDRADTNPFDAIMIDTDNGPDATCLEGNAGLYEQPGIARLAAALSARGVLAVWSAHPDPAFEKRLHRGGFTVRAETVKSRGRKGSRHTIFVATPAAHRGAR